MSAIDRVRLIHLRSLLARPGRTALALMSAITGSAILVAVMSVPSSVRAAADHVTDLLPPDSLLVLPLTDTGLPVKLADELSRTDGVAAVAPLIRHRVIVGDGKATVLGVDARALSLRGRLTPARCGFAKADLAKGAVIGPGLHLGPGDRLPVRAPNGARSAVTVVRVAPCEALASLDGGRVVLTSLPLAQSLTGRMGRADLISVVGAGSRAGLRVRLQEAVGDKMTVQALSTATDQARGAVAPLEQGVTVVAGITLLVAGFIVFNTMSLAVSERRRQFAVLRAIGSRRRPMRNGLLAEGLVIGLVGSVVGAMLGLPIGGILLSRAPRLVIDAVGYEPVFDPPPFLVPAVIAGVTLVAVAATLEPARQLTRVSPVEAMRGTEPDASNGPGNPVGRHLVAALAAIVATLVSLVVATGPFALVAMVFATIALVFFIMAVGDRVIGWAASAVGGMGRAGRLAAIDLTANRRQTMAILIAVVIAVSTIVGYRGLIDNLHTSYTSKLASLADPDLVIQMGRSDEIPLDHRLTDSLVDSIESIPGVAVVNRRSYFLLNDGAELVMVIGVEPGGREPSTDDVPPAAVSAMHRGEGVVVNATLARRRGLGVGDSIELPTDAGIRRMPIVGVGGYFALTPGGVLSIDFRNAGKLFGRTGVSSAYVRLERSANRKSVSAAIRSRVSSVEGSQATIRSGDSFLAGFTDRVREVPNLLNSILIATVLAAALAVVNAVILGLSQRRRDLSVLRALGGRRRLLARSVALGTLSLGLVGTIIGLAAGIVLQPIHVHSLTELLNGSSIDYQFSADAVLLGVLGALVVLLVGVLGPSRLAGRGNVVEALRSDES